MAQQAVPASILEMLTRPNPSVQHETPRSKTNTRGPKWYSPKQLKRWKEFENFENLELIFGGRLLQEARRGGRTLPSCPNINPRLNHRIRNETDTRDLIQKWNQEVVTAALEPIHREFRPVIWRQGDPPQSKEFFEVPPPTSVKQRVQPPRKSSKEARKPRSQSLSRLMPDSGSTAWNSPPRSDESEEHIHRQERFPKEYKVATKWRSEWVIERELIDEAGEWQRGGLNDNCALPIRQAFTYCIQHMCRYGCILTCEEAFIFRVQPRDGEPDSKTKDKTQDDNPLRTRLINNGLMEYISIPWKNHDELDTGSYRAWTVNLALWFMHVLAGNKYEADWRYGPLRDEELVISTSFRPLGTPALGRNLTSAHETDHDTESAVTIHKPDEASTPDPSDSSDDETLPFGLSSATKRKRDFSEPEDGYSLSFSKRTFPRAPGQK